MNLLEKISQNKLVSSWQDNLKKMHRQLLTGVSSLKALLIASSLEKCKEKILVVTPTLSLAYNLVEDLRKILSPHRVMLFSVDELISAKMSFSSPEARAERIEALDFLMNKDSGIIVVPAAGVRKLLPTPKVWHENHLSFAIGAKLDLASLRKRLFLMGYHRVAMVNTPGEFSIRGSIIDLYPLNTKRPYRVDFFDNQVDSIRTFEADTQRSLEKLNSFTLSPASDLVYSQENLKQTFPCIKEQLEKRLALLKSKKDKDLFKHNINKLLAELSEGAIGEYAHYYSDFLYEKKTTIFDYLSNHSLVYFDDYHRIQEVEREITYKEANWQETALSEMRIFSQQSFGVNLHKSLKKLKQSQTFFTLFHKGMGNLKFDAIYNFNNRGMQKFFSQLPLLKVEVNRWLKQKNTVIVLVPTIKRIHKVEQLFCEFEIKSIITDANQIIEGKLQIILGTLSAGFEFVDENLVVITEREIFYQVTKKHAHRSNITNAERLKSYNELSSGDYVVHVSHGIGRFLGIKTLEINGIHQDYLTILYQNEDKIFVPVTQINLISKYIGSADQVPKINRLSDVKWKRTRLKVTKQVENIADDLITLYAKREAEEGFAFSVDNDLQAAFEAAFPYIETDDQLRSTSEIKKDMEKIRPMDRLLVGDVGFGKTEVALRAAFKAIQDNKQVAFLVPTTILAQQHFNTMAVRFAEFPVKVAVLSRFQSRRVQKQIIKQLSKGAIDIVVGTHRMLSQDVKFNDLGLLIIDEEQRFGVKHKERIKQLRFQIDVLTLTATPIPRTLHLSMMGVRDLSVIETPPAGRFPVQTYVMERNIKVICEGIVREMARYGQVFYLYNLVETIENKVTELKKLVPKARIAFAHGQMTEIQLEKVLYDFIEGDYDVLVSTTIIETGVDIPNVNTIFVENADYMGLATLYQLRGRVGRSNRVAYAYFMYKPEKILNEVSEKRLEAIKNFTELGSGFKIAMRDLSIRGAGNLLGAQQHGFIDAVGFDMYSQMLEEAVRKKQGKEKANLRTSVEIDLGIDAYLPAFYISDERQKVEIYKRICQIDTHKMADELEKEMIDRFGDYPEEVAYLLIIGRLKMDGGYALLDLIQREKKRSEDVLKLTLSKQGTKIFSTEEILKALSVISLKADLKMKNDKMNIYLTLPHMKAQQEWMQELSQFVLALTDFRRNNRKKVGDIYAN
ncbi:MAG: transcription-repair coupling factor [Streptococcaceae bacterium]|jgi:transcription-repair coupling factor (superfamily II helicase)|nr:transcription-repair coupling factor [Streptococcaceae bacterium]